jgi:hypothetical protein
MRAVPEPIVIRVSGLSEKTLLRFTVLGISKVNPVMMPVLSPT